MLANHRIPQTASKWTPPPLFSGLRADWIYGAHETTSINCSYPSMNIEWACRLSQWHNGITITSISLVRPGLAEYLCLVLISDHGVGQRSPTAGKSIGSFKAIMRKIESRHEVDQTCWVLVIELRRPTQSGRKLKYVTRGWWSTEREKWWCSIGSIHADRFLCLKNPCYRPIPKNMVLLKKFKIRNMNDILIVFF